MKETRKTIEDRELFRGVWVINKLNKIENAIHLDAGTVWVIGYTFRASNNAG